MFNYISEKRSVSEYILSIYLNALKCILQRRKNGYWENPFITGWVLYSLSKMKDFDILKKMINVNGFLQYIKRNLAQFFSKKRMGLIEKVCSMSFYLASLANLKKKSDIKLVIEDYLELINKFFNEYVNSNIKFISPFHVYSITLGLLSVLMLNARVFKLSTKDLEKRISELINLVRDKYVMQRKNLLKTLIGICILTHILSMMKKLELIDELFGIILQEKNNFASFKDPNSIIVALWSFSNFIRYISPIITSSEESKEKRYQLLIELREYLITFLFKINSKNLENLPLFQLIMILDAMYNLLNERILILSEREIKEIVAREISKKTFSNSILIIILIPLALPLIIGIMKSIIHFIISIIPYIENIEMLLIFIPPLLIQIFLKILFAHLFYIVTKRDLFQTIDEILEKYAKPYKKEISILIKHVLTYLAAVILYCLWPLDC